MLVMMMLMLVFVFVFMLMFMFRLIAFLDGGSSIMMRMRGDQYGRNNMDHTFLHRHIAHGDRDVLVDRQQGEAVEVADVEGDVFGVKQGREFELYTNIRLVRFLNST